MLKPVEKFAKATCTPGAGGDKMRHRAMAHPVAFPSTGARVTLLFAGAVCATSHLLSGASSPDGSGRKETNMKRTALSCAWLGAQKGLLWVGAIALVVLAVACGASDQRSLNPVSPSVVTEANGAAAMGVAPANEGSRMVPRDVTGDLDGRFTFAGPWVGPWEVSGDVTGTLSHLGLTRMHTMHTTTSSGTISGGVFEVVAANGDEIQGTYTATGAWVSADQVLGAATLVISGGTGRFACATGTITATFLETIDDPTWASAKVTWTLTGTVNY